MNKQSTFVRLSNMGLDDLELYKKEKTGYLDNVCCLYIDKTSANSYVAMASTQKVLDFYKFNSSLEKDDIMNEIIELFSDDEMTDFKKAFEASDEFNLTDNIVVELPLNNGIFKI